MSACCQCLKEHGHLCLLPNSGARVFVDPEDFVSVAAAARLHSLKPSHVIVAESFESIVKCVVEAVPKKQKIYLRQVSPFYVVPAVPKKERACSESVASFQVSVTRTFIHVELPNSLCSTLTSGPNTV